MKHVMVFSTSVESALTVAALSSGLDDLVGEGHWNFDLDDCDRILRVVAGCRPEKVIAFLDSAGFCCAELSDEVPTVELFEDSRIAS